MIAYCPLDEEPFERPIPNRVQPTMEVITSRTPSPKTHSKVLGRDNTECNYVVMFFIAGVVALALIDSLPRK